MVRVFVLLMFVSSVVAKAPNRFVDFAFEDLNSDVVESDKIREGKVLLVKIGQLNCPLCTLVLQRLGRIDQEYAKQGAVFLDVSLDEDVERLRRHAQKHDVDFPTLLDSRGDLATWFGVSSIPVTMVVSRGGEITDYEVGDLSEEKIRAMLDKALAMD